MVSTLIIQKCKKNNSDAQKQMYNICAGYVYTIIKSYVKDDYYIKDIMQDSFASIFNSLNKFDENKGTFKGWIGRIAIHKCIDHLRFTNKINLETELDVVENFKEDFFSYLDELSMEEIKQMLVEMPEGYKTIFMLSVIDEFSHNEIAEMLKITAETSRSQLHRALKWLKKNIAQTSNLNRYEAL